MIIARGDYEGGPMLLLGLSGENIRRLLRDQPIKLTRETHGDGIPDGWTILIIAGPDERSLARMVKPLISDTTQVFKDPRL